MGIAQSKRIVFELVLRIWVEPRNISQLVVKTQVEELRETMNRGIIQLHHRSCIGQSRTMGRRLTLTPDDLHMRLADESAGLEWGPRDTSERYDDEPR